MAKSNSTKAKTKPAAEELQEGVTDEEQVNTTAPATEEGKEPAPAPAATEGQQDGTPAPAATEGQQDGTPAPAATEGQQDGTILPATEAYVVDAPHGLNLRKAPRFGAKVLTILPSGAEVYVVLGMDAPAGWLPVLTDEAVSGWVYARYLKKIEE